MSPKLARLTPILLLMFGMAACNQARSPETVNSDVANARKSAAHEEDRAERKVAQASYDASVSDAEARRKVAVAKCEALAGDAHKACTDQADAALATAKADAEAQRSRPE